MKKIKSVKRNGVRYTNCGGTEIWQSRTVFAGGLSEWVAEDVIRNCPLFEVEYEKERWRARMEERYYYLNADFTIESCLDMFHSVDNGRYNSGNYFRTEDQTEKFREILKSELEKFHKSEGNYD